MNYQHIYGLIIENARQNPPKGFSEKHHIVPRCLGGGDEKANMIRLSARQHFVSHLLLAKIHGGKLVHAAWRMANDGKHGSREYSWLRTKQAEQKRRDMLGNKYAVGHGHSKNKGHKASPEAIENMRQAQLGKTLTPEHRAKIGAANAIALRGKRLSMDVRAKLSVAHKGKNTWSKGRKLSADHKASIAAGMLKYKESQRRAA
jgi:hypothetical protein